jgi:hypothetical protein
MYTFNVEGTESGDEFCFSLISLSLGCTRSHDIPTLYTVKGVYWTKSPFEPRHTRQWAHFKAILFVKKSLKRTQIKFKTFVVMAVYVVIRVDGEIQYDEVVALLLCSSSSVSFYEKCEERMCF